MKNDAIKDAVLRSYKRRCEAANRAALAPKDKRPARPATGNNSARVKK